MSRPFRIDPPDADGDVWIFSPEGEPVTWGHNLGPIWRVAQVLKEWLAKLEADSFEPPSP